MSRPCCATGEELTVLSGPAPAHPLSDLSHWYGSRQLQAPVMPDIHDLDQVQALACLRAAHSLCSTGACCTRSAACWTRACVCMPGRPEPA